MRYGVQMFGLNPLFLRDKRGFLSRLSTAGYRFLEPCIALGPIPGLEDRCWLPADLEAMLPLIHHYGFSVESAHVFTRDLQQDLPELIALAKKFGISQYVLACPLFANIHVFRAMAQTVSAAAGELQRHGISLLLHNDRAASQNRVKDRSVFEAFLELCSPAVGLQPDVGWLLYGGIDPEAFLWKHKDRIRSLHYKDMAPDSSGLAEVPIGTGVLDMTACFQFARAAEIIQYADQDDSSGDFLADMEHTAEKFRSLAQCRDRTASVLCIMDTETLQIQQLCRYDRIIEAPNWMQSDPDCLIYNSDGHIFRYRISTGEEVRIDTGHCVNCNNDHVLSPEETHIAVSHSQHGWMSQIYILPIEGGQPRLITPNAPSYLHGWSPDGKELAYCAFRDRGNGYEVDIWAICAEGGDEWQLTQNAGFNDGPEYSPDGKHIWFISTRSSLMQCWRMDRDGGNPTQMTFHPRNNWFPHVSPDGKQVVYLSYSREGLDPNEHLPNMPVQLRLMNADGSDDRKILDFFGGQGSINVNSWHPDSRHLAFVRYELEHK